jgi:hypothetical protein
MSDPPNNPAASGIPANEDRMIFAKVIPVKDQIFRFASVFWIPAFAGTTPGNALMFVMPAKSGIQGYFQKAGFRPSKVQGPHYWELSVLRRRERH